MINSISTTSGSVPSERVRPSLAVVLRVFFIPSTHETSVMHITRKKKSPSETEYPGIWTVPYFPNKM